MKLVGIVGKKRSGKDTFASILVEGGWRRAAFADELKKEVAAWLGVSLEELEDRKDEFRATLQERGMTRRREDPEHWIRLLVHGAAEYVATGGSLVVTDVRLQNEADWVRKNDGLLVRMKRFSSVDGDTHVSETDTHVSETDTHASETEQDGIAVDETFICASAEKVRECARWFLATRQRAAVRTGSA